MATRVVYYNQAEYEIQQPGHQRIIAMYKPITIIHENNIIAHETNISSMKTRKSLTLVDSKCDKTVTACASLKKDNLSIQKNLTRREK